MFRPFEILIFIGLGAAFSSGCDRSNDAVGTESERRSATHEPKIRANNPSRGCTAHAKCPNGTELDCSVSGSGTCSGVDGVGVQCITYDKNGNPEESGGTCASS
jgi:hypothetical protein